MDGSGHEGTGHPRAALPQVVHGVGRRTDGEQLDGELVAPLLQPDEAHTGQATELQLELDVVRPAAAHGLAA